MVHASSFKKTDQTDDGQEIEEEIPFLKEYTVLSANQCEGLPPHFYQRATPPAETLERIERAEQFFAHTQVDIRIGGNWA